MNAGVRLRRLESEYAGRIELDFRAFLLRPEPRPAFGSEEHAARALERFRRYTTSWERVAAEPDAGEFRVWASNAGPPSHSIPAHQVAKAAARLVHPHIASVYDATPEAIAMQRINGETLAERGNDDPRELAALVRDAALAIHFAHGEGIIHRDLKPANLMVEPGDRPHIYVMDFGVAKELTVDASISLTESVIGTPVFMAPEQAAADPHTDHRADIYALGIMAYEMLCGQPPFTAPTTFAASVRAPL